MKKSIFLLAAIAAVFAGCAKELDTPNNTVESGSVVTLKASMGEPSTRMSIDGYKAFGWQAGDVVSVLNADGEPADFETTSSGTEVDFSGVLANGSGSLGKYAMYPASDDHLAVGDDVNFHLPDEITWKADATNIPMLGKISAGKGSFKAVGGVLKLICYNIPSGAEYMWFISSNARITGDFEIADASVDAPVIATSSSPDVDDVLQINFAYSANKVFYIPLPTGVINGFTVEFYDGSSNELFSKHTTASFTVSRNQMTIGPALNCSPTTILWSEDWTGYSKDNLPSAKSDRVGLGGVSVTYTETDGAGTSPGTTKIYEENSAGGTSPELLVGKKGSGAGAAGGTFKVAGIPTNGAATMNLSFKHKKTVEISLSSGVTASESSFTTDGSESVTLTNSGVDTFDITFTATTTNNVRLDDIVVSIPPTAPTAPTITTGITNMNFAVGTLSRNTTVSLTNAVDGLGLSWALSGADYSWVESVAISAGTLTVKAVSANVNADANEATLTIKATGAAKVINLTQASALVQKPASISAIPGNETFTAQWTKAEHATGYKAYLCASSGLADPTGGTELTPVLDGSTYTVTKSGLTNGTTYYLYVKVNSVDANYVAEDAYKEVSVTPDNKVYYEKITSIGSIVSGEKYLIVNETNNIAFNGGASESAIDAASNFIDVTIGGGKIVANSTTNAASFVISGTTDAYTIKSASGYFIGRSSSTSGGMDVSSSSSYDHSITFDASGNAVIIDSGSGSDLQIKYNSGGSRFRYYTSAQQAVQLYKLNDPRTPAGITWKKSGVAAAADGATMLTGDDTMPTIALDNPNGLTVTFTSSDPTVATVSASSNATSVTGGAVVSLLKAGSTTITADFADGDATYKPSTVSYILTVTDSRTVCATPSFSPAAGAVAADTDVTITSATSGATIYYTTDGSTPTTSSSHGTIGTPSASVTIDIAKTIKAIAVKYDYQTSAIASASYTLSGIAAILSDPSSVSITAISSSAFTATWADDANASDYTWMLSTSSSAPVGTSDPSVICHGTKANAALSAGTWTLNKTGLTLSGKYYFYVKAVGDGASYSDSDYSSKSAITLKFSLTSNPGGWPTSNSTTLTDYTYTLNAVSYTFKLYNVKQNSGYLMMTKTAGLGLPAISGYKLTKVVANNSNGCSTSVKVGISSTAPTTATYVSGGATQTWSTTGSTYTYSLSSTSANTVYYMYVTSANAQVTAIELSYFE